MPAREGAAALVVVSSHEAESRSRLQAAYRHGAMIGGGVGETASVKNIDRHELEPMGTAKPVLWAWWRRPEACRVLLISACRPFRPTQGKGNPSWMGSSIMLLADITQCELLVFLRSPGCLLIQACYIRTTNRSCVILLRQHNHPCAFRAETRLRLGRQIRREDEPPPACRCTEASLLHHDPFLRLRCCLWSAGSKCCASLYRDSSTSSPKLR